MKSDFKSLRPNSLPTISRASGRPTAHTNTAITPQYTATSYQTGNSNQISYSAEPIVPIDYDAAAPSNLSYPSRHTKLNMQIPSLSQRLKDIENAPTEIITDKRGRRKRKKKTIKLTFEVQAVLERVFSEYSTPANDTFPATMQLTDWVQYINFVHNNPEWAQSSAKNILEKVKTGEMTLKQFLQFYEELSQERPGVVMHDLKSVTGKHYTEDSLSVRNSWLEIR